MTQERREQHGKARTSRTESSGDLQVSLNLEPPEGSEWGTVCAPISQSGKPVINRASGRVLGKGENISLRLKAVL